MKLSDLMPDRDSLVSRDSGGGAPSSASGAGVCASSTPLLRSADRRFQRSRPELSHAANGDFQCANGPLPNAVSNALLQQQSSNDYPSAAMRKLPDTRASAEAGTLGGIEVNNPMGRNARCFRPAFETD